MNMAHGKISKKNDKQWAILREAFHSIVSYLLFYTMLKFPLLGLNPNKAGRSGLEMVSHE